MGEVIEQWRLSISPSDPQAWVGEKTATFNRDELSIIVRALSSAEYEGSIDKSEKDRILDILNIEHSY